MLQDLDEYKNLLKPRLKSIVQTEDREWFIVFISKAITDNAVKLCKKVYGKVEADFSSKKRERYSCATWTQLQRKVYVIEKPIQYLRVCWIKYQDSKYNP